MNKSIDYSRELYSTLCNGSDATGYGFIIPIDRMEECPDDDRYYRVVSKPIIVRGVECRVHSDWFRWRDFELNFKWHDKLMEYHDFCIEKMVVDERTVYYAEYYDEGNMKPNYRRRVQLVDDDFGAVDIEVAMAFVLKEIEALKGGDD